MAIFAQMSAQGVDCLGPLPDQQFPDTEDAGSAPLRLAFCWVHGRRN